MKCALACTRCAPLCVPSTAFPLCAHLLVVAISRAAAIKWSLCIEESGEQAVLVLVLVVHGGAGCAKVSASATVQHCTTVKLCNTVQKSATADKKCPIGRLGCAASTSTSNTQTETQTTQTQTQKQTQTQTQNLYTTEWLLLGCTCSVSTSRYKFNIFVFREKFNLMKGTDMDTAGSTLFQKAVCRKKKIALKQARKPRATLVWNYDWLTHWLTDLLTRVKCRATSVAKNSDFWFKENPSLLWHKKQTHFSKEKFWFLIFF